MRARDILSDFATSAFTTPVKDDDLQAGIFSDVYGTLIKHGGLDELYYKFLVWCLDQGVPVTLMSSEPTRAAGDLRAQGVDERLLNSLTDKLQIANAAGVSAFEAIIDDSLLMVETAIYINPVSFGFRKFVSTGAYKATVASDAPTPRAG